MTTVAGAHNLDVITFLLGEFKDLSAYTRRHNKKVELFNSEGQVRVVEGQSDDSLTLNGTLHSGTTVSFSLLTVPGPSVNPEGLSLTIFGEKGALKIETPGLAFSMPPTSLSKYNAQARKWEEVETAPFTGLADPVGSIYETYASGSKEGLVTFEEALVRHRLIDAILKSAREGTRESYDTTV